MLQLQNNYRNLDSFCPRVAPSFHVFTPLFGPSQQPFAVSCRAHSTVLKTESDCELSPPFFYSTMYGFCISPFCRQGSPALNFVLTQTIEPGAALAVGLFLLQPTVIS